MTKYEEETFSLYWEKRTAEQLNITALTPLSNLLSGPIHIISVSYRAAGLDVVVVLLV